MNDEYLIYGWFNVMFSIAGLFAGIWAMQRPSIRRARMAERMALGIITIGLGWSALQFFAGDVRVDGARLCITAGVSSLLTMWTFFSANETLAIRRRDNVRNHS